MTGLTPNISEFCNFNFYDLVWYWQNPHPSLCEHDGELARWIGFAHNVGSDMVYWLMPVSGIPIANSTIQHVTTKDMRDVDISQRIQHFMQRLNERLDVTNFTLEDQ